MTEQAWRDVPAGRDLDRIVAERLGLEVRPLMVGGRVEAWAQRLDTPTRKDGRVFSDLWGYEMEGWWEWVPPYSTDIGEVLRLPLKDGDYWRIHLFPFVKTSIHDGTTDEVLASADGGPQAFAATRAWLAYTDDEETDDGV